MGEDQDCGRVALVHDYWVTLRGGERVFLALMRMFPQADCYVLLRGRVGAVDLPQERRFHESFLQHLPFPTDHYRALLPLYPVAARQLDLRGYDLVISSSSGFCHAAQTDGLHICYCHSPLRYAWHEYETTLASQRSPLSRMALAAVLNRVRRADYTAAQRVGAYVANSHTTQERIRQYYGRESTVVHPFVDTARFSPLGESAGYVLVVSRLLPYKRVDLAVQACTRLGLPLVVVGEGPERARLARLAGPTVTFRSQVDEAELVRLYQGCSMLLQCGVEDFGMAALEAQACGRPVLAYGAGGALETMAPGVSGAFFAEQSVAAVQDALRTFRAGDFDPQALRAHAERFQEAQFEANLRRAVVSARRERLPVA